MNGCLAAGLPANNSRTDDFEFEFTGEVDLQWNRATVEKAVSSLALLKTDLSFLDNESGTVPADNSEELVNEVHTPIFARASGGNAFYEFQETAQVLGSQGDYGVDMDCMTASVPTTEPEETPLPTE